MWSSHQLDLALDLTGLGPLGPGPDSDLVLDSNIFHFFLNIRTKDKLVL